MTTYIAKKEHIETETKAVEYFTSILIYPCGAEFVNYVTNHNNLHFLSFLSNDIARVFRMHL